MNTTSSAVSELREAVTYITDNLKACLERVNIVSSQVSSIHQDITKRMVAVKSTVIANSKKSPNV